MKFFLFHLFVVLLANDGYQTDWSGGPGVMGPLLTWGNVFYLENKIEWSGNPGSIALLCIENTKHTIDGTFDGAYSVYSEDIDGDGDMDVLGAATLGDEITWWENTDSSGRYWLKHTVDGSYTGARAVLSEDIDCDGDMDVLGAATVDDEITWWENIDGSGKYWTEHLIADNFDWAESICSEDIDDDGDLDVFGVSGWLNCIKWWENSDGLGTSWIEHTVDDDTDCSNSICSEDIDGDGDMDLVSAHAYYFEGSISWWENTDNVSEPWIRFTVDGDVGVGVLSVHSEDIDGDGDMDIVGGGSCSTIGIVSWWENIDASGNTWVKHDVDGNFTAYSVYAEDMNGDGDMDVLGAASQDDDITWWENIDGSGTSWAEHTVDGNFEHALSVYAEDINGDGDMDILGAAYTDDEITWWDLASYDSVGSLESSILDTRTEPYWSLIDWTDETPPNTSVSCQVRASDTYENMGQWSDTLSSPCSLEGILSDGDQYVQYRIILDTSDPFATPMLEDITITWDPLGIGSDPPITEFLLLGAEPNPVCGIARIGFTIPEESHVELSIFDLAGHLVLAPAKGVYSPGVHQVQLGNLTPGIYFCRMDSEDFIASQRFVVIE